MNQVTKNELKINDCIKLSKRTKRFFVPEVYLIVKNIRWEKGQREKHAEA